MKNYDRRSMIKLGAAALAAPAIILPESADARQINKTYNFRISKGGASVQVAVGLRIFPVGGFLTRFDVTHIDTTFRHPQNRKKNDWNILGGTVGVGGPEAFTTVNLISFISQDNYGPGFRRTRIGQSVDLNKLQLQFSVAFDYPGVDPRGRHKFAVETDGRITQRVFL